VPVHKCTINGKMGWMWGSRGKCYEHSGDKKSSDEAKRKAYIQGYMAEKRDPSLKDEAEAALANVDMDNVQEIENALAAIPLTNKDRIVKMCSDYLEGLEESAEEDQASKEKFNQDILNYNDPTAVNRITTENVE